MIHHQKAHRRSRRIKAQQRAATKTNDDSYSTITKANNLRNDNKNVELPSHVAANTKDENRRRCWYCCMLPFPNIGLLFIPLRRKYVNKRFIYGSYYGSFCSHCCALAHIQTTHLLSDSIKRGFGLLLASWRRHLWQRDTRSRKLVEKRPIQDFFVEPSPSTMALQRNGGVISASEYREICLKRHSVGTSAQDKEDASILCSSIPGYTNRVYRNFKYYTNLPIPGCKDNSSYTNDDELLAISMYKYVQKKSPYLCLNQSKFQSAKQSGTGTTTTNSNKGTSSVTTSQGSSSSTRYNRYNSSRSMKRRRVTLSALNAKAKNAKTQQTTGGKKNKHNADSGSKNSRQFCAIDQFI